VSKPCQANAIALQHGSSLLGHLAIAFARVLSKCIGMNYSNQPLRITLLWKPTQTIFKVFNC